MKKIFTLICAFSVSYFASAQADHSGHNHGPVANGKEVKKVAEGAPEALLLKQTEHDFGKIPQGKPVTYAFTITNSGTTPLILENVVASCGCTTPEWSKEPIAPGGSSKITVGYNAAAEGVFNKPVTITYNGNQTKQLMIKGEVWKTPTSSAPENSGLSNLKK